MSGGDRDKRKKEDDIDEQKNKGHRTLNKKLKKKRKHEKEVQKEKKLKKKEYQEKRDKYREQYFAQAQKPKKKNNKDSKGIKIHKLQKTLNKFLKIYEDDIEDFKSIFTSLDEGEEIEIQDIENPKIRKYLAKIFKYLKIKQKSGKPGFRKSLKTDFSLSTYMFNVINEAINQDKESKSDIDSDNEGDNQDSDKESQNSNYDSDSSSDDEDEKVKEKKPSKKLKKNSEDEDSDDLSDKDDDDEESNQKNQKQQSKQLGPQLPSVIGPQIPNQIGPLIPSQIGPRAPSNSVGPSLISQEEKQKFIEGSISQPQQKANNDWLAQDLDSFLNDSFKEVEASNVKKFLLNQKVDHNKKKVGQSLDSSRLAPGSAPIDLEHIQIDDSEARQSASEYESKYRNKTLMEMHQENLLKKKQQQGKDTFRKPFDRNEDLIIRKTDSKKLMAAIKDSFQHGPKFQPAKN
ncbi:hypothetical protein TTHERM_00388520 (macronuclear) [Tetrahymena thermophila SB210]|uniref:DUF3752 domain-containing protein n=1 Tax=Tetrahymena thermophila (strain SB210) TaxID=312017 RepID=Q23RD7_TETTS|nr:hypothetical protein TTHERM_00388520 [Tetrahymena thermophila SB210]EAR99111.1 hypothetical protein TTHERM_00388520 [Tetrahymena thermophila SB210]|eukprot:XP_001019356.1 hypothetical protein TTHERM_00388520 [Tetrahymena thermophila SB210]